MKKKWNQWLVLSVLAGTFALQGAYAQEAETVDTEETTEIERPHPKRMGRLHSESLASADADADGLVSAEEFAASVDFSEKVAAILIKYDADEDGQITPDEVASVHASAVEERLTGILARWDADEDGQITAEELDAVGKGRRGHRFVLEGFDADEDGIITSEELLATGAGMLEDHVAHLQESYDADEDGILTTEELNAAHAAKIAARWEALLGKLDTSADGLISTEELALAAPAGRGKIHAHQHDDAHEADVAASQGGVEVENSNEEGETANLAEAPERGRRVAGRQGRRGGRRGGRR